MLAGKISFFCQSIKSKVTLNIIAKIKSKYEANNIDCKEILVLIIFRPPSLKLLCHFYN